MQVYRLLSLRYGNLVVCLAQFSACLIAYGVEWYLFGKVIFVSVLFLYRGIYVCKRTIIVYVVFCGEGMPKTS